MTDTMKLRRINAALIRRIDQLDAERSSTWSLARTAALLEKEVLARNRDLERALAELSAINAELATARAAAEEANRAKSRFLRAASHDLLQPLSAAKLFLSHLGEVAQDAGQRDLVARINANFESAEELIRALLEIARLDSRKLDVNPAPVSLWRLFQRLSIDMQGLTAGLDLRFVPSSAVVTSDPVYLRRIAQNLISNALKYTESGRVLVGARRDGDAIWLEVHDTGPGIAPADQRRIFNEFERLSRSDVPGMGLGLSIVNRACAQLDHRLEVRSHPGRGSLFRVRLPLVGGVCLVDARPAPGRQMPGIFAQSSALVVENDPNMRQAFVFLLESWGMSVAHAQGTVAALRHLERGFRPDVILTDYRLEHGDTGVHAIASVRAALGSAVPALIVSGECADAIRKASGHLGAAVLEKPVAETALREAVNGLLRGVR
ncbi:ATP-binding response regulator [Falsirhodobacter xinxiangensis]|uniref:ATP-binding response regulator n=1 Tax=Falsirhodobacter xinxiangensis TaxID=2530049 RepID=UPI0010AA9F26|nr:hybrid sensor histidine kinase/response regulator [Rhodobacter xinxiangensis]